MLRTFGGLAIEPGGFRRLKPLLLIAYLALEGRQPRRRLARLFFPEATDPLKALGMTLTRVRQGVPGALDADAERAGTHLPSDVAAFRAALAAGDLDAARHHYRGPFLDGVELRGCGPEVEEWLFATRERCAEELRAALIAAAEVAAAGAAWREGAELAEAAWRVAGAAAPSPTTVRRLHRLFVAGRSAAVAELTAAAAPELAALDASPAAARAALRPMSEARAPVRLPPPPAVRVGRAREEAALLDALTRARCVVLTGMAGVGKSHLALCVAWRYAHDERFGGGVHAVALEAVTDASAIATALAAALGLRPTPGLDAFAAVAAHFADREALLLLDNVEQIAGARLALDALLAACAGLRVLVTSRTRIGAADEVVVPLTGLPTPDPDAPRDAARASDAVRLFVARAARVAPAAALDDDAVDHVAQVCRSLEGHPLAIELAAAWTRLLAPARIASELEGGAELLRHGTEPELDGALERSWAQLSPADAQALTALAVFRGGFDEAAAAHIAGIDLPGLARLVDASLVRPAADGRFDQHPLLLAHGRARLAASGREAVVLEHHAAHFLAAGAGGAGDVENVRAAWRHATRSDALARLAAGLPALERALAHRPSELAAELEGTLDRLADHEGGEARDGVELALRLAAVPPLMSTQGYAAARVASHVERARALGAARTDASAFPVLWGLWGFHVVRGSMAEARALAADCARLPLEDAPWLATEAQRMVAESDLWSGRFGDATPRYLRALAQLPGDESLPSFLHGHHPGVTMRSALALTLWCTGAAREAFATSTEAQAVAAEGHPYGVAYATTLAAVLGCMAGDHVWTLAHALRAEEVATAHGFTPWAAVASLLQGWVACREGDAERGGARLRAGLDAWRATGAGHSLPFFHALLGEAQLLGGQSRRALATLDEGIALADAQGEHWWTPELHRLRGTVHAALADADAAAVDLRRALELADAAGALGWSERARASLTAHASPRRVGAATRPRPG